MTLRFGAIFVVGLSLAVLGCATTDEDSRRYFGLDDAQLNHLGKNLGFQIEARGMSNYSFSNEEKTFFVAAHNEIDRYRDGGPVADEPVIVFYRSKQLAIPISQGMTMPEIEAAIRNFIETK